MKMIVYDCRNSPKTKYRDVILRIFGDDGELEIQAWCLGRDPVAFASRLASDLRCELDHLGPAAGSTPSPEMAVGAQHAGNGDEELIAESSDPAGNVLADLPIPRPHIPFAGQRILFE